MFDADHSGGLTDADAISGIEAAAADGPGVINLSFGGVGANTELPDEIYSAFRRGSLVVAGFRELARRGNPINFPANMAHVLTVAATNFITSPRRSPARRARSGLAAPGVGAAVPLVFNATGYESLDKRCRSSSTAASVYGPLGQA